MVYLIRRLLEQKCLSDSLQLCCGVSLQGLVCFLGGREGSDGGIISDLSPPTVFFNRLGFTEGSSFFFFELASVSGN